MNGSMDGIKARCEYVSEKYISINNCGQVNTDMELQSSRPEGRRDYMLIYATQGTGFCLIDERKIPFSAGDMVILRPNEPLVFGFCGASSHYWLHFTGSEIESTLRAVGIPECMHFTVGCSPELSRLFLKMIFEMQMSRKTSDEMCIAYFLQLLSTVGNILQNDSTTSLDITESKIYPALEAMTRDFGEAHGLSHYAALCNLSLSRFKALFTKDVKMSPTAYITKLKIEHAKNALYFSNLSISEIAYLIGFNDPLYFSRFFKKHVGRSPRAFRDSISKINNK